ncbi:hypothetical protein KM043_014555 [Ampulex compressa]|nr:hypothetical protein KM043_014555 [Ampulex compressa]
MIDDEPIHRVDAQNITSRRTENHAYRVSCNNTSRAYFFARFDDPKNPRLPHRQIRKMARREKWASPDERSIYGYNFVSFLSHEDPPRFTRNWRLAETSIARGSGLAETSLVSQRKDEDSAETPLVQPKEED